MDDDLQNSFRENWRAIDENISVLVEAIDTAIANGRRETMVPLNVGLFQSIFNYDLSMTLYDLAVLPHGWKRNLQARLAALLVIEFVEDIAELLGKEFRTSIETILETTEDKQRFRLICKNLALLRDRHEKDLRTIRNISIAHREKDARKQLDKIRNLDVMQIMKLGLEIVRWQTSLKEFLTYIQKRMNGAQATS